MNPVETFHEKECLARMVNVSKSYNGKNNGQMVLSDINFQAYAGEMVLLLGPSGSGKTTFLTLLGGMLKPTAGEVYLFNTGLEQYSQKELQRTRAEKLGFVFQTFKLLESVSVLENLLLVLRFSGIKGEDARLKATTMLREMGLEHHIHSIPGKISQGEKQRVALARALVNDAVLIIADEPTGNLNTDQGMKIAGLLKESVSKWNKCVIIASHDERISRFADRILLIRDGKIV